MPTTPPVISFFVACYNEEANIAATLDTLLRAIQKIKAAAEIVVIDDASKDNSVKVIQGWIDAHPGVNIKLLVNEANQGWGMNYAEGAFHATGDYYRAVCGDNVELQETFETVIASVGKADVVLFYYPEIIGRPLSRKLISRMYTFLVNTISGYNIKYYNGMPLIKRTLVMRWHSNSHGFGYQADLVTRLLDRKMSHLEVSVQAVERAHGKSKAFTARNIFSVGHTLLNIAIRRISKMIMGYN